MELITLGSERVNSGVLIGVRTRGEMGISLWAIRLVRFLFVLIIGEIVAIKLLILKNCESDIA